MLTGRSCQGLLGKRAAVVRIRQLWSARLPAAPADQDRRSRVKRVGISQRDSANAGELPLMRAARRDTWGARDASGLDGALVVGAEAFQLLGIETDAEGQSHRSEDGLDLVERLLAEVLGLEQIGFGLLHQVGDDSDICGLDAVERTHRQLQLMGVAERRCAALAASH